MTYIKPPIGIEPKNIWLSTRYNALNEAIQRYKDAELVIPIEWVEERNELVKRITKIYKS
jgi:hypothetical protein